MSDRSQGLQTSHHEYTYRLPTPPRIVVPPPTLTTDMPELTIGHGGIEDLDMSFLKEMDLEDIVQKNTLLEWAYERRRQAQMILPWLYLGPMVAARDKAFLAREGITMALAIRTQPNSMRGAMLAANEVCLEVASIESPTPYGLTARFAETTSLINRHIARVRQHVLETTGEHSLGKVLVFCESGNGTSAAIVASYLMETLNDFDYIKAMQVCQAQRFCINFDDTLKTMLRSYWDILQAKRSIASYDAQRSQQHDLPIDHSPSSAQLVPLPATRNKRSLEHTRDDDDTMMADGLEESDALRFVGRDITPFYDH